MASSLLPGFFGVNHMFSKVFRLLGAFLSLFIFSSSVSATEYEFIVSPPLPADCDVPVPGIGFGRAGILTHIDARFNSTTKILSWTVTFKECKGRRTDGYWNAINNGPNRCHSLA